MHRRSQAAAIGFAVCVGLGLGYVLLAPPSYTAQTDLMIDIRRTDMLSQQHENQDAQTLNAELESQVEILRSEGLARQVVERLNLTKDPLFDRSGFSVTGWIHSQLGALMPRNGASAVVDDQQAAAEQFIKMTSVRRLGLTYVIEISVKSPTADLSSRLANGLVDAYIVDQLNAKETTTKEASLWLQDRLTELRDQATAADAVVEQYTARKEHRRDRQGA